MDGELYDEFGNYIGSEVDDSDDELSEEEEEEEEQEDQGEDQEMKDDAGGAHEVCSSLGWDSQCAPLLTHACTCSCVCTQSVSLGSW